MPTKAASKPDAPSGRTRSKRAAELQRRQQILDSAASKPFGTLSALPAEIILSIFSPDHLDIPTLVTFRLVNTHCKALVDSIPQYNFLSTTHPVVIRALSAANATTPTCADVAAQLRGKRCAFCGDTAAPEDPNAPRTNHKFWSYFYLPTAELICLPCYRQGTVPFPPANGNPDPPSLGRDLIPWSVAHLRKRLMDPKRETQVNLDEYLDRIPRVRALPFIHHATRKPVMSPLQTRGLEFCDARAVKRLFDLDRPMWEWFPKEGTPEHTEVIEQNRASLECVQAHEGAPLVIEAPHPLRHSSGKRYARRNAMKVHQGRRDFVKEKTTNWIDTL